MQAAIFKFVNAIEINGIHDGSIVGQHGRQRPTDDFTPIDNGDAFA